MPNGHHPSDNMNGYDERGWIVFREKMLGMAHGFKEWTEKHEREEFDHHRRVETHMEETKAHIAAAAVGRVEVERRLGRIEANEEVLFARLGTLGNRVWWLIGVSGVAGGVATILVIYLLQHKHVIQ